MLKFYFHQTPNPMKVAVYLEETGLPYELIAVDTLKGEQHTPEYRAINPNGKTPAIEDEGKRVFDSTAILMYLSEKTGKLAGKPEDRGEMLSWLMFIATGLGPFSGQSVHFRHKAPEKIPYAIERYINESKRLYGVLNKQLMGQKYVAGEYSIADMAILPWALRHDWQNISLEDYPYVQDYITRLTARPAVQKALAIQV